jgi:hypothetical protein
MALLETTRRVLQMAEEVSGRPIRVQEDPQIAVLATITMARGNAPAHLIRYRPLPGRQPDYHICYQCGFVIRLFQNPPERRFDFGMSPEASSKMDMVLSDRSLSPQVRMMKDTLLSGILTQLRSIPIGLRIDNWLWSESEEMRDEHIASARLQLQQNAQGLAPSIRRSFPRKIVNANTAMNAAFALFWAEKLNDPAVALPYRSIGATDDGQALLAIFRETDSSPEQDWTLVDRWAEYVKFSGWYTWVPHVA